MEASSDNMLDTFQDGDDIADSGRHDGDVASSPVLPSKEGRIFKRAKRIGKMSPKSEEAQGIGVTMSVPLSNGSRTLLLSKNSRRSRDGRGRGLPKKGGAGGKGVWGAPGSEIFETSECQDEDDPNYDSDNQDYIVEKVTPFLTISEILSSFQPIMQEYFEHGDTREVLELLESLNIGPNTHKIVEAAISLALERHDPQREMTSRLISDLYGCYLSQENIARAFDSILRNIDDLCLDTPNAPEIVGKFIARVVADDCLPPSYLQRYKGHVADPNMQIALSKAEVLLSMKHGIAHLDNIWGEGGGNRPVKYLTNQVVLLLKEYLNAGDIEEATRCLKDIDVPHFHHELVYQAAVIAIEDTSDRASCMMVQLLKSLVLSMCVTPDQFSKGMKRVFDDMPDICLDMPFAYELLDKMGNRLYAEGVLTDDLLKEMPTRGRKRFVSEGDGGLVKTSRPMTNGH